MTKIARAGVCLALLLVLISVSFGARAECPCDQEPPWPAWVFGHIVWEDESTTASVHEMVNGYKAAGVPVDGIIIDSPWETAYNTFEADPQRYPDLGQLVKDMHAQDIKVIMWITPNVNLEDPEYQMARDKGYFVKGFENRQWWKGPGGWIDYENPEAVVWWHNRMNRAIDLGIDGWKADGTDPYLLLGKSYRYQQRYARAYYSDFYDYTRERTGGKQVVMARPYESGVDERTLGLPGWTNPLDLAVWLKFAPIDKSWASWVGDQDPTFDGMTIARRRILYSAKKGYLILGSDIGGYREYQGQGPQKEIFIRWAQFGALCPFMENGGGGEHRAFAFDKQTLDIYRELVFLHKALLPYLYSEAVEAWREGRSIIKPLAEGKDEYLLGNDILVAPVTAPGGKVRVVLPPGNDWMPLYADEGYLKDAAPCLIPDAAVPLLKGGCSFTRVYPLDQYPVFFRAGALIPLVRKYAEPLLGGPAVASCPLAAAGGAVVCPQSAASALPAPPALACSETCPSADACGSAAPAATGCPAMPDGQVCPHCSGPCPSTESGTCLCRQGKECPNLAAGTCPCQQGGGGCPHMKDGKCPCPQGHCTLPAAPTGDLVLVVPLAPGKSAEVGRIIYMEGKEPVEISGSLRANDEFDGDVNSGPDWQPLVAPESIPAR